MLTFDASFLWSKVLMLLNAFAQAEVFRLVITIAVVASTSTALRFIQRKSFAFDVALTMSERRQRTVLVRNVVILLAIGIVISIWSTRIAGFALSLAAVAGALLIVSKDAITNLLGFGMMTVVRPYQIGDFIEIMGFRGKVVDVHAMGTTLLETCEGYQITGQTVIIPNSLLLSQVVRNLSATGDYTLFMLPIPLSCRENAALHEAALLKSAGAVIEPWRALAEVHFKKMERIRQVKLPSADPKVIVEMKHENYFVLSLRFCCQPNQRVKVEQEILRLYLQARPLRVEGRHDRDHDRSRCTDEWASPD